MTLWSQQQWVYLFYRAASVDALLFQNAFSNRLSPLGFNMFEMLVVDLMHEIELGVWKAVFVHLLCLLESENIKLRHELDRW